MEVTLDRGTSERIRLLTRAWETTPAEAIARLLDHWVAEPPDSAAPPTDTTSPPASPISPVAVHMEYRGQRAEGWYEPHLRKIRVTSGPGADPGSYLKPSPAAIAVVRAVAPDISPHRNGWRYWVVTETGEPLQSIR